jgi:hypothetical protein
MRTHFSRLATLALATACTLGAGTAHAYPNAIVYAPSGDVKGQGQAALLMGTAFMNGNPVAWQGFNIGLLPTLAYGETGLSFGGLEVGADLGASQLLTPTLKAVFNAKAQLLTETGTVPSLSVGTMQNALLTPDKSLSMAYASLSKTLSLGETSLGRLTLGGGQNFPGTGQFIPTAPFSAPSNAFLLAGYESPAFGPFYLALDHIGGVSEVGGTYVALNLQTVPGTYVGLGYTFCNDRSASNFDSALCYISTGWDVPKAFGLH